MFLDKTFASSWQNERILQHRQEGSEGKKASAAASAVAIAAAAAAAAWNALSCKHCGHVRLYALALLDSRFQRGTLPALTKPSPGGRPLSSSMLPMRGFSIFS